MRSWRRWPRLWRDHRPVADRPRLIELSPFEREAAGSFISAIEALGAEAIDRGWTAEAVFPEGARKHDWIAQLRSAGIQLHFAPPASRRGRLRWLRGRVDGHRGPLVMHSHFTAWDVPVAMLASPDRGRHVYWHIHTVLRSSPLAVARNVVKFAVLGRRVDGVLCPVPNLASELRRRGVPRSRIHLIPNGIDSNRFPLLDEGARARARRRLGIPGDAEVLLHFGWNWRIKGGQLFLESVAKLAAEGTPRLLALAQGDEESARDAARRLGIEGLVRTIGTVTDVTELFAAADVFLATSEAEGGPYAVMEALCCGRPVVASDLPGHAMVADVCPGCTLVARTPEAVAAEVRRVLERPSATRASQSTASHGCVAENLTTARAAARMLDLFEGRLAATKAR